MEGILTVLKRGSQQTGVGNKAEAVLLVACSKSPQGKEVIRAG